MKRLSVILVLALCMAHPAFAELYKWVDSDGRVQYSDKPPPSNIKTEKLHAPGRAAPPAPAASEAKGGTQKDEAKAGTPKDAVKAGPKTAVEQDQAFRKRRLDAAKAQKDEAQKQAEAENCKRAKAALANLQIGGRQMRIDEKGERVYLDDQQIVRETARAREEAAAACN